MNAALFRRDRLQLSWLIGIPALVLLALSLGVVFLPRRPLRKKWPFVLVAAINAATVAAVLVTPHVQIGNTAQAPPPAPAGNASNALGAFWINGDGVDKHSCPSPECGVVGQLSFRDPVDVYDMDGGWVRVSPARKALCVNGRTRFIKKGSDLCDPSNGIEGGTYYDWIPADYLSRGLPSSGSAETDEFEAIVAGSQDFRRHRDAFAEAAGKLVDAGTCSKAELAGQGGFARVTGSFSPDIYFAYCGGDTMGDRVFVDTKAKRVFR